VKYTNKFYCIIRLYPATYRPFLRSSYCFPSFVYYKQVAPRALRYRAFSSFEPRSGSLFVEIARCKDYWVA